MEIKGRKERVWQRDDGLVIFFKMQKEMCGTIWGKYNPNEMRDKGYLRRLNERRKASMEVKSFREISHQGGKDPVV